MDGDTDRVDDYTLALLYLAVCEQEKGVRGPAWKTFDWATMNRLHEKGYISDPKKKTKSIELSEKGFQRAKELFTKFFGSDNEP